VASDAPGSTFDAAWLELREAADHRSRAEALVGPLDAWLLAFGRGRVLDLGAGTGSNLRWLAPRLTAPTRWTLLDRDARLLARARGSGARLLRGELAGEGILAVQDADLVTASALLDLVSAAWLARLVDSARAAGAAALFALTWDGTVEWRLRGAEETDAGDALVLDALRVHQERDKGLGPALGPRAGEAAEEAFREAGFSTRSLPSPWRLGPADRALALGLLAGWETAAREQLPRETRPVASWAARRRATLEGDDFELVVGHADLLALPPRAP